MGSLPRSILVLFGCAVVLLAAGCGGGSGHRLSDAAFRSRANHICSELNRKEQPDLASNTQASVDRNLGRIDAAVAELEGLRPPPGDEPRYQALLTGFKRSVAFVKANEHGLIKLTQQLHSHPSDARAMARYQRLVRPLVHAVENAGTAANALGLGACARGLSGSSG